MGEGNEYAGNIFIYTTKLSSPSTYFMREGSINVCTIHQHVSEVTN